MRAKLEARGVERTSIREMYEAFVQLIYEYQEYGAFYHFENEYGDVTECPTIAKCKLYLRKARFNLEPETYQKLEEIFDEIIENSYSTLAEVLSEENVNVDERELQLEIVEYAKELGEEFYEELCSCLGSYFMSC